MSKNKVAIGMNGESLAVEYLIKKNFKIITRNYRCRFGEIDIIASKDDMYIFIEVKTRRNLLFGRPSEAINGKKREHCVNAAQCFIKHFKLKDVDFRFDAVEIILTPSLKIEHIENIFF